MKVIVTRVTTETFEYESEKWDENISYEDAKQQVIECIELIGITGTSKEPIMTTMVDFIDGEEF